jgi:hypothetical protein
LFGWLPAGNFFFFSRSGAVPARRLAFKPQRNSVQAILIGTTSLKRANFGVVPVSPKKWYPRRPLPTQAADSLGFAGFA